MHSEEKAFERGALLPDSGGTTQAAWAAGDPAEDEAWKKEPAYGKER